MKRWFRPVAYSIVLILLALAIFGKPAAETSSATVVLSTQHPHRPGTHVRSAVVRDSVLHPRSKDTLAVALFDATTPAVAEESPETPASAEPAPPPDLKILGWMQSDEVPTVFVEYANEHYTLTPTQAVNEVYRFDKIGGGLAVFTYLPTGESRQYAVSDPALSE